MGVELNSWVETIRRHPLKYKYEGLDGFHQSVNDAALATESYREKLWDNEFKYHYDQLEGMIDQPEGFEADYPDCLYQYFGYLSHRVSIGDIDEHLAHDVKEAEKLLRRDEHGEEDTTEEVIRDVVRRMEQQGRGFADTQRSEYVTDYLSGVDVVTDQIENDDSEALLNEHPPVEVWSHAYEEGVDVNDVAFLCPSCHREPQSLESLGHNNGHFYCGLCGAEYMPDHGDLLDLRDPVNLEIFADTFDLTLWPLKALPHVFAASDPAAPEKAPVGYIYFHGELVEFIQKYQHDQGWDWQAPDLLVWDHRPEKEGIYYVQVYGKRCKAFLWDRETPFGLSGLVVDCDDEKADMDARTKFNKKEKHL